MNIFEDIKERIEFVNGLIFDKRQSIKRNKKKFPHVEDIGIAYISALESEISFLLNLLQKYEQK